MGWRIGAKFTSIFDEAIDKQPSIIVFDEFDSVAKKEIKLTIIVQNL